MSLHGVSVWHGQAPPRTASHEGMSGEEPASWVFVQDRAHELPGTGATGSQPHTQDSLICLASS